MEPEQLTTWQTAFEKRDDLKKYADNAIGLFALALKFGLDDLETVAAESLTDGGDDKGNDIVYIDTEQNFAVIVQCYKSRTIKESAPAKKATDMNGAISWLLNADISTLPSTIKASAIKLREGIGSGEITTLHAWYVHNCDQSTNVENELATVGATINSAIRTNFKLKKNIQIFALEVGNQKLTDWYNETESPILVNDVFTFSCPGGFSTNTQNWKAFVTALSARSIHDLYNKNNNKTKLFSANVRDYLGSRDSDTNINNSIKQSVKNSPEDFWVYNNGITAITHKIEYDETKKIDNLRITGISIVNGAQTTGAIGGLDSPPNELALIPVRFVETNDNDVIQNIVRYNNRQNQVTASDFRSTDAIQKRLRAEIEIIPNATYDGGRRGGISDAIKRRQHLLPSYTVGQALAAFHGNPILAYNKKSDIWTNDAYYSKYFNENTTGAHIVFVFGLLRSIETVKLHLLDKSKNSPTTLTTTDKTKIEYFGCPGAVYVLIHAIASCLELTLGRPIPELSSLGFGPSTSPLKSTKNWEKILSKALPFVKQMKRHLDNGLNSANVEAAIEDFKSLFESSFASDITPHRDFAKLIKDQSTIKNIKKSPRKKKL